MAETVADNSKVPQPSFLKTCEEMEDKDLIEKFSEDPIFMHRVKIIVERVKGNKELLKRKGSKLNFGIA